MLFLESKTIKGERKSTYWCMSAVLNSLFLFFSGHFLLFFSFVLLHFLLNAYFWVMVFPRNYYYCDFSNPPLQCIARGPLYRTCSDWYLLFQPLTAFVQCGCPCRPLTGHQLFSHHHLPMLVVSLPSARQRRLFCLFACCSFSTCYSMCALSPSLMTCTQQFQLILT